MNDIFKEYGADQSTSVQEAIEKFAVDLLMMMCGCPKKIVLDKHTYNRYQTEILKYHRGDDAIAKTVMNSSKFTLPTPAGKIEIICED